MKLERIYTPKVLATTPDASIAEAAAAMRRYGVGTLLVMGRVGEASAPVGMVTDRDLAIGCADASNRRVGDAMTPIVATVSRDTDTHEAVELMRAHGVRRLVVTDPGGEVRGIVSIDDIVDGLAVDLAAASAVLKGQIRRDSAGLGEVRVA